MKNLFTDLPHFIIALLILAAAWWLFNFVGFWLLPIATAAAIFSLLFSD